MPDQNGIHKKSISRNIEDRKDAARLLESHFSNLSDKDQVWQDLHGLTQDGDSGVRWKAAGALGSAFSHVPDKDRAWQDLHRLTQDEDSDVRWAAAYALGFAFSHLPDKDKDQAWWDLHRLTKDEDSFVRWRAAYALDSAFRHIPDKDKDQARWDLRRITLDESSGVRWGAAYALGSAFSHLPDKDKDQAWWDLQRLTLDESSGVRWAAADALGSAFSHLPDKDKNQAWWDLQRLTHEGDSYVRMYAYYSLGKASVFKATEAEDMDTLKNELVAAVAYFEKSSQDEKHSPARFCCSFYRSYLAITFEAAKEEDVQRYLAEAKGAVGGSEIKDELLMAIENLARALQESQRLKAKSVKEVANELNSYRLYCEKAAEYMTAAEDKAPGAVRLLRKCNPILDDRIKAIVAEIQEKARLISPEIEREARCLSLGDPIKVHKCSMRMAATVRALCGRLPEELRQPTLNILLDIERDDDLSVVLGKIELAMAYTLPAIDAERRDMIDRLKNIEFNMSRLNLSSGSARQDLFELKTIIKNFQDRTEARGFNMEELSKILRERDNTMVERLEKMKESWLSSVEEMAKSLPSCKDKEEMLEEIHGLKQSRKKELFEIMGDISSIVGLFTGLIGLAYSIKSP